uniref:Uncharacterized protein n=1 Tax=Ralstonia syzygii R24 TaxID=907261 RepID=G3ACL8_9RALS|nr:hypothetical protein RALSY_mp30638 [Ralstonia syzygii R24]
MRGNGEPARTTDQSFLHVACKKRHRCVTPCGVTSLPRTAFSIDENTIPEPPRPIHGYCTAHVVQNAGTARVFGMFLVGV